MQAPSFYIKPTAVAIIDVMYELSGIRGGGIRHADKTLYHIAAVHFSPCDSSAEARPARRTLYSDFPFPLPFMNSLFKSSGCKP
ncbi:hypothetical protein J27TS7_15340 [Paenibacillus dendritiformis]|uniref:hypothetical protein n=1 Tax=Paenibacillus dendritiformis TaxID=130049 RepID=UPI001B2881F4|nr:hypothetical protein [Paenibacillus dendritiformis]GIO72020.1 hypothetical protein J27TS7_15340 [Paenibacillus dendritiformis]